jgi:hypothetical protein
MITFVTILECSRDFEYICNVMLCLGAIQVKFGVQDVVNTHRECDPGVTSPQVRRPELAHYSKLKC